MMRALLPLVLLFSTSSFAAAPIRWSETLVKNLNTKTLRQAFCEKNVGYRVKASCDYFSKEKAALDQKVSSARVAGNSLFLKTGKRELEIKSTTDAMVFEINRRKVDMKEYQNPEELLKALNSIIPKLASRPIWINIAEAQDTSVELMNKAALFLMEGEADERFCDWAANFNRACNTNLADGTDKGMWEYVTGKIKEKKVLDANDKRWIESDGNNLRTLAYLMREAVKKLNRVETQNALKLCPSVGRPPLANALEDVRKCDKVLNAKQWFMKNAPTITGSNMLTEHHQFVADFMEYILQNEAQGKAPMDINEIPAQ